MTDMVTQNTGAVATQGDYDPYAEYGQAAAGNTGDFLKFSKGEWLKGANDDEVALETKLAANMSELSIGWVRWNDRKPVERRMGLIAQRFKAAARDELGFSDEAKWENDESGKPQDPWQFTNELPLADPESGEQMTLSASSKGAISAIGALCKAYAAGRAANAGKVPIVSLGRDSYKHKVYGKTYVPVLTIVDWVDNGAIPDAPKAADDDEAAAPEEKKGATSPKF